MKPGAADALVVSACVALGLVASLRAAEPASVEVFAPQSSRAGVEFQVRAEESNPKCKPTSWTWTAKGCAVRRLTLDTVAVSCSKPGEIVGISVKPQGGACGRVPAGKAVVAITGEKLPPCEGPLLEVVTPPGSGDWYYRPGLNSTGATGIRVMSFPCMPKEGL